MADVMPDYALEQQRLKAQIASFRHNLERHKLEIMEVESRKRAALDNIAATCKAIAEHEARLAGLIETHGVAELDLDKVRKELRHGG